MVTITKPRGQWTAKVSGMGTLPVMCSGDLNGSKLTQKWTTKNSKDALQAQKQFDAVVSQLTAGNPERRVRAVVLDMKADTKGAEDQALYEFTLENMKVDRFRNGMATYNYQLIDGTVVS